MKNSANFCLHTIVSLAFLIGVTLLAKEPPAQVIVWPTSGAPLVRFAFGKFKEISSISNMHSYLIETTAENLSNKPIESAVFNLYLFDKAKVRVGEGWISLNNVAAGQSVRFDVTVNASGTPFSLELAAKSLPAGFGPPPPPRTVSITVNSVPQGAGLKVDDQDMGTTPKIVQLGVGKHMLEFTKEGFNIGHFPMEIGPNDASGGSVSYELGASAHDTIELRDGSVLSGDLDSLSGVDVAVRIGGALQHYNRNQVKRILLVERATPNP